MNPPDASPKLPPEILYQIFSYLDPIKLVKAGTVCRDWHGMHKINELWKRHCQESPYGKGSRPYNDSWKQRFVIMHNWEKNKFQSYEFKTNLRRDFFIDNGSYFECTYENDKQCFSIRNITDNNVISFKLEEFIGNAKIVSKFFIDNKWVFLNTEGIVSVFDVYTGKLLNKIETNTSGFLDRFGEPFCAIICNTGKFIILNKNTGAIDVWDQLSGKLENTFNLSHHNIIKMMSSSKFILCLKPYGELIRININSGFVLDVHTKKCKYFLAGDYYSLGEATQFCISDEYTVFVIDDYRLNIYKNEEDKVSLIEKFNFKDTIVKIKLIDSWVYVLTHKEFQVFDINSKKTVFLKHLEEKCSSFETDGNSFILQKITRCEDEPRLLNPTEILYYVFDFRL